MGEGCWDDIQRMNETLVHRGPDDCGIWCDESRAVYLAHRRLSIIDIDGGHQPMWTDEGTLGVVYNGEIYNHPELRKELEKNGHRFKSNHSDTEVLLHGYRQWGEKLVDRLNGMWAFAIYEPKRSCLFLSRDRFGKKPLYYTLQDGTFAFASEMTALLKHRNLSASLSISNMQKYFAYGYLPAPRTIFANIWKLPGGHNLHLNLADLTFSIRRYWRFQIEPFGSIPKHPEEEWGECLRDLLYKAVKRRLMSDVPLGIFLSGGIDSSAIATFARDIVGRDRLQTFSIGFEDSSFDESSYAEKMGTLLGTRHKNCTMSTTTMEECLSEVVARLDEPMGDSSLLPTFLLSRETRKSVTVSLGGDGGDEMLAGYDPFRVLHMAEVYNRFVPNPVHKAISLLAGFLPTSHRNISIDFKIKRSLRGLNYEKKLWNPVWMGPLEPVEIEAAFSSSIDQEEVYSEAIEIWESCNQENIVDKTLQFFTELYLQDDIMFKVDRASMMNSLEVRSPYLDIEFVDFVRRIPWFFKLRRGQTKYILKKALEPVLPHEIIYRPKKGFGIPIGRWFKNGFLELGKINGIPGLNKSFLLERQEEHQQGAKDHRLFLWNVWLLDAFLASKFNRNGCL